MTEEIFDTEEAIPETPEVVPRSSSVIEFHRPHLRFYKDPESDPNQGKLILEPLQKGYGQTMGLSLKTVLVSQMPGQCIKRVRVEGLDHRYSRIKGIKEPLRVILMNFSRIIIRAADPLEIGRYELSLRWPAEGPVPDPISTSKGEVLYPLTARYITGTPLVACDGGQAPLAVVNPEGIICHLEDPGAKLDMTLIVESGVGYVMADPASDVGNEFMVNQHYTPVLDVAFDIEDARVGQDINFDRLTLDIRTNGAMRPETAVKIAAELIKRQYEPLAAIPVASDFPEEIFKMVREERQVENKNLDISIKELEFSVRSRNCLEQENIRTLGELAQKRASELLAIKNFGKKSLNEIRDKLSQYGLNLTDDDGSGLDFDLDDDVDAGDEDDDLDLLGVVDGDEAVDDEAVDDEAVVDSDDGQDETLGGI